MRRLAILAIVLGSAAATSAGAQATSSSEDIARALSSAAFAPRTGSAAAAEPLGQVLDREAYAPGLGPIRWTSNEVRLSPPSAGGPVDTLRISLGGVVTPGGLPLALDRGQFETDAYDVSIVRDWPSAFSLPTKLVDVDLSPHAGVGVTSLGASAEAGAELRLSQRLGETATARLRALGVRDGAALGDQGRWYLFAAASGRAVGLNMLHDGSDWNRAGWTTDATSALVGDAQVGVGWRRGALQTSLGYVHREMKGAHMIWGQDTRQDSMVAFSLSIKPRR
jgi:hypothetical protein